MFTAGAGALLFWLRGQPTATPASLVILFSAYGAIMGWLVNTHHTSKASKKQHTINVLLNHTSNPIYHQYSKCFMEHYPPHEEHTVTVSDINDDHDLREAIRYLLNEYEFIAAGLKRRDLDYDLLKDTIRKQLCTLVRKCDAVIKDARGETTSGHILHPKVYEHLLDLHREWAKDDPNSR